MHYFHHDCYSITFCVCVMWNLYWIIFHLSIVWLFLFTIAICFIDQCIRNMVHFSKKKWCCLIEECKQNKSASIISETCIWDQHRLVLKWKFLIIILKTQMLVQIVRYINIKHSELVIANNEKSFVIIV